MSTPAWDAWLQGVWGPSYDGPDCLAIVAAASNVVCGTNPPFTIQDFFALFPKFGGPPITPAPTATTVEGSPTLTVSSFSGMKAGNPIAGAGIPDGALIQSVSGTTVTMTAPAQASASGVALTVWNATPIPVIVILTYITLASGCLVQARWLEQWTVAMCYFVAHFLTLYAYTDGNPLAPINQIASQGLAIGIAVNKSVGDVSVGYQLITGWEDWGAWNLSVYGQMLSTWAAVIGAGPVLLY